MKSPLLVICISLYHHWEITINIPLKQYKITMKFILHVLTHAIHFSVLKTGRREHLEHLLSKSGWYPAWYRHGLVNIPSGYVKIAIEKPFIVGFPIENGDFL